MKYLHQLLLIGFALLTACAPAQEMTQEEFAKAYKNKEYLKTEVWKPQPTVVSAGYTPSQAPSDAIVLFDGKDLSNFTHKDEKPAKWTLAEGAMTVKPGTGEIISKQKFGDCQLHIEWKTPVDTTGLVGQQRGNSGVFLMSYYEVQVLDSYENETYADGQAGAVYGCARPKRAHQEHPFP